MTTPSNPNVDYTKEVRFAVVMYGGVSLAIYINGVAQELLRMVKSTAPSAENEQTARPLETKNGQSCGTEAVYRKLSYLLDSPANRADFRAALADKDAAATWQPAGNIHVRFMVDVLAGTSAGGINSIYLAKALANDQSIDQLKNLWVTEGDIHVLINDGESLKNTTLARQKPPHSLLNSARMYLKLLAALDAMDTNNGGLQKKKRSPLVDELDLYITATDIRGLALPIRLADAVVFERRHRNVFHFKYATANATGNDVNEFRSELNPFLAFAARTTSSFPFAFEPVRLADIRDLLDHSDEHRAQKDKFKPESPLIRRFFQDNLTQDVEVGSVNYDLRSFADGGYLDNKPFSYATSTLMRRTPTVPVDRKLIYVEPSPEHAERDLQPDEQPDAIQNVLAALSLPRYETIREDIQFVLERNRLIERVNRLTRLIERDIEDFEIRQGLSSSALAVIESDDERKRLEAMMRPVRPQLTAELWDAMQLSDMVGLYGVHYLPYRRLRISALTDEIATLTARVAGFDESSDMFLAIRALVQTWRDATFSDDAPEDGNTLNRFLNRFDLAYRLRRLNFLVTKIDELLCLFDQHAKGNVFEFTAAKRLVRRLEQAGRTVNFDFVALTEEERDQTVKFLLYLKCELNQQFIEIRKFGRDLRKRPALTPTNQITVDRPAESEGEKRYQAINEYKTKIAQLGMTAEHLQLILGATVGDRRIETDDNEIDCFNRDEAAARAKKLWDNSAEYDAPDLQERFADAGKQLDDLLSSVLRPSGKRSRQLLDPREESYDPNAFCAQMEGAKHSASRMATTVRSYLWEYFKHFDDYDQISFPIYFETDVGESDIVEVIRISPEDAPSLINEKKDARGRKKLAGTRLANFSAFLDAAWRVNDIMWGRLDGAERLIKSMLPDERDQDIRDALTREAHQAILNEELSPAARADLARLLGEALVERKGGLTDSQAISKILKPVDDEVVKQRLSSVMTTCLQGDELYAFMRDHYEVNRQFEPQPTLRVLGRATRVIGNILDDISRKNNVENKFTRWISRVGQIFLGLVEVAVPDSLASLLFRHWLKLLYAFEIVLLFLSTFVLSTPGVASFAWKLLALTLATNFAVFLLRDYMRGRNRWVRVGKLLVLLLILGLVLIGIQDLRGKDWSGKIVEAWHAVTNFIAFVGTRLRQLV